MMKKLIRILTLYKKFITQVRSAGLVSAIQLVIAKIKLKLTRQVDYLRDKIFLSPNYYVTKFNFFNGMDYLIYVAYSSDGVLTGLHKRDLQIYFEVGYRIILVVNVDNYNSRQYEEVNCADVVIYRENLGFDFSAWKDAVNVIGGIESSASLSFTNDSVILINQDRVLELKEKISRIDDYDVVFLTENFENNWHGQSYFFSSISRDSIKNVIATLNEYKIYKNKVDVIWNCELTLANNLKKIGSKVDILFKVSSSDNPTFRNINELVGINFPYIKISQIGNNPNSFFKSELGDLFSKESQKIIREHIGGRGATPSSKAFVLNLENRRAFDIENRLNTNGALQAINFNNDVFPALVLPLEGVQNVELEWGKLLIVLHAYYVDIAIDIVNRLNNSLKQLGLLQTATYILTTDSEDKKEKLEMLIKDLGVKFSIRVFQNRGRDVGPFLEVMSDIGEEYEYIMHLHTKKSLHDSELAGWGEYIYKNLFNDESTLKSNLLLLSKDEVGLVYSGHYLPVSNRINWGFDFPAAKNIMGRIGVKLSSEDTLEFPAGTMFIAKYAALKKLFDLNLKQNDFESEAGQVDGTLAHSIERCICYIVEESGYKFLKVCHSSNISEHGGSVLNVNIHNCLNFFKKGQPTLISNSNQRLSKYYLDQCEIYPICSYFSEENKIRFNILIPTVDPEKIYGGISSAIANAKNILAAMPNCDVRVIVTSDDVTREGLSELVKRLDVPLIKVDPSSDIAGNTVVPLLFNKHIPLSIRKNDVFYATAWWTADLAFRIKTEQRRKYKFSYPIVYLIQDYEPGFYSWSTQSALAESTYQNGNEIIAIINSEELTNFFESRYKFRSTFCLPYEMDEKIYSKLRVVKKEKIIIVYGRPSVARNLFKLILESLRIWQLTEPAEALQYQIKFAGENFDAKLISELNNAESVGKLSLDEYGELLSKSAIGISLMLSPHPSYPPLEMATANCITITNDYDCKKMMQRSSNIISLSSLSPNILCEAINAATVMVRIGEEVSFGKVNKLNYNSDAFSAEKVIQRLLN